MSGKPLFDIEGFLTRRDDLFESIVYDMRIKGINKALRTDDPTVLEFGAIVLCTEGRCSFTLDSRHFDIGKNTLCVMFPRMTVQTLNRSEDLNLRIGIVNVDFFKNLVIPSSVSLFAYIKDNPAINVTDDEMEMINSMVDIISREKERRDRRYRRETVGKLLEAVCYEIASVYMKDNPMNGSRNSHSRQVFYNFLSLVESDFAKSRMVTYYAGKLCLTPKYLSTLVKEVSGKSANEWINDTVIINAKILLKNNDLTIQQISDMLHFSNPSFFGQYFKRYTGTTPNRFRNSKQ